MQVHSDLVAVGLYLGFIVALGLPAILLKACVDVPSELMRKLYHFVITLSIFPLVTVFSTWTGAVLAALTLVVLAYPALALVEHASLYRRIAVEREGGEFKRSLVIVQASMALLIAVFWGLLGSEWKYVAVVAVMAWGFGDAAAALVGKRFGRRRIRHPRIEGTKTLEGTQAMWVTAGAAVFLTLVVYAGYAWDVSLAVAMLVAPVCALVELFSNRGMDTLTVPITAGLAVVSLMSLFSHLGVL